MKYWVCAGCIGLDPERTCFATTEEVIPDKCLVVGTVEQWNEDIFNGEPKEEVDEE